MDAISSQGAAGAQISAQVQKDPILLKKAQEAAETQANQLLQALPPPVSPPGVGGSVDLTA